MVVLGAGLAIAIVPSMSDMITEAKISGMPDDLSTDALVGGYFNAIVFTGEFLGPVIGGKLIETYRYLGMDRAIPQATGIFGGVCFVMSLLCGIGHLILYFYRQYR